MNKSNFFYFLKNSLFIACMNFLGACNSTKNLSTDYIYFQDKLDTVSAQMKDLRIQPSDLLSIQVYSKSLNQDQAAIFNIPNGSGTAATANSGGVQGYQVSLSGTIDMPIIGSLKAAGLTREQLQTTLIQKLAPYVKDPSVIVRFLQININVLGEVRAPGIHSFKVDKITILDAISAAGDLTDFAKRENIMVIREEEGQRKSYLIDLRDGKFFHSPAYQLRPNDIVYISANKNKLKTLNVDPEAQRKTGLVIGIVSIATTIATLIITLTR